MEWLLGKVLILYKLFMIMVLVLIIYQITKTLSSGGTFVQAISIILGVTSIVIKHLFNMTMLPLYEMALTVNEFGKQVSTENKNLIGGMFQFFMGLTTIALIVTITIYIPFILIIMPFKIILIAIDKKTEISVWAYFVDPLQIFNLIGIPMVRHIQNMSYMESDNKVIKQMATNEDLAQRIKDDSKI